MKGLQRPQAGAQLILELDVICVIIVRSIRKAEQSFCWASVSVATASLACHRERNGRKLVGRERGRKANEKEEKLRASGDRTQWEGKGRQNGRSTEKEGEREDGRRRPGV